jgi:DNA gyrase subunit A
MIINKSGIVIRVHVADFRVMGRATQGVRLINLEKRGDEIGSVCKVNAETTDALDDISDEDKNENLQNSAENSDDSSEDTGENK